MMQHKCACVYLKSESNMSQSFPDLHTAAGVTVAPQVLSLAEQICSRCVCLENASINI